MKIYYDHWNIKKEYLQAIKEDGTKESKKLWWSVQLRTALVNFLNFIMGFLVLGTGFPLLALIISLFQGDKGMPDDLLSTCGWSILICLPSYIILLFVVEQIKAAVKNNIGEYVQKNKKSKVLKLIVDDLIKESKEQNK